MIMESGVLHFLVKDNVGLIIRVSIFLLMNYLIILNLIEAVVVVTKNEVDGVEVIVMALMVSGKMFTNM